MADLKDKFKEGFSEVAKRAGDVGSSAAELATKAGKSATEVVTGLGAKAVDAAQAGAEQAVDAGQSLYSRLRGEEKAELEKLGAQKTLAELSEDQQDEYLWSLLPMLVPFDPPDVQKLRRVYQILTVMELGKRRRRSFFDELFFAAVPPEGAGASSLDEPSRISLGKDLLGLSGQEPSEDVRSRAAGLLRALRLSPEQIEVISQWTSWENKMLEKMGRGDLVVGEGDMPVEAMKKAGAIGVPLGALYASGSIVGFSAAGLTSGLATLGSASGLAVLGLNPMTAGIAALILMGVGVKKLLDAQLPTDKADKQKKFESAARAMQARRNRYLAILGQDLIHFRRAQPEDLPEDGQRRWFQAVWSLEDLLESEAQLTLGEG